LGKKKKKKVNFSSPLPDPKKGGRVRSGVDSPVILITAPEFLELNGIPSLCSSLFDPYSLKLNKVIAVVKCQRAEAQLL